MKIDECLNGLPSLLTFNDGSLVESEADWRRRRDEVHDLVVSMQYGDLPPVPNSVEFELLHETGTYIDSVKSYISGRICFSFEKEMTFGVNLYVPHGDGPFPVVIFGDGCWPRYVSNEVIDDVVGRGYVFVTFNRCELAKDVMKDTSQDFGLYTVAPKGNYGALAAWAWGYHRVVDVLVDISFADAERIAITGHSRGGKTVLLAAATDERIALVGANNSGAGGAGCYHWLDPEAEKIENLLENFTYWFNPEFSKWIGRELELPFDQHFLKALIAPRAQINMTANADLWANPVGTRITHEATKKVYDLLDAGEKFVLTHREGEHAYKPEDCKSFLDFADKNFA
ncbi:MAG: hypothetical protein PF692_09825 [Kiritimatiellae bacterium]|jgi:hypothetical protein|nr:hypothetical protein [Kiritimatiellia bacterium]